MPKYLQIALIVIILMLSAGCNNIFDMEAIDEITDSFNHPSLSRGGTYSNPFPNVDLSSINRLPIYISTWSEECGKTELNTFFASYGIAADDNDINFNEPQKMISFFRYDSDMQFWSSYKSFELVNPVKSDSDLSCEIELPLGIQYTTSLNGTLLFSDEVKNQISDTVTLYLNDHEDLFGHVNETFVTDFELSPSTQHFMARLEARDYSENATDAMLNYFGFLDNLKISLHYNTDSQSWDAITFTRCSEDRYIKVGEYDIVPYSEALRRFRENDKINYTLYCDYAGIENCDVYLMYIMDSDSYIRPIYVCTSADFVEYDNACGSFAWIDAIDY